VKELLDFNFIEVDEDYFEGIDVNENDLLDILPTAAKKLEHALPDFLDTKNKTQFERFKINGRSGIKKEAKNNKPHVPFSYNNDYQTSGTY
jgi:hypothetical protein